MIAPSAVADEIVQEVTYPDWTRNQLSPAQHALYTCDDPLVLVVGGRYGGKDHVCALRAGRLAHELYAQNRDDYPHEGCCVEVAIIGGEQKQANTVFDKLKKQLPHYGGIAHNGKPNYREVTKPHPQIILFGDGIRFSFLPVVGDGSNLVAPGYDIVVVTEAAFLPETAIRDYIKPLVIRPGYSGHFMANSTSELTWYDYACYAALTKEDPSGKYSNWLEWSCFVLTSFDNPRLGAKELKDILAERKVNPARFRRRYMGELFVEIPTDAGSLPTGNGIRTVYRPEWLDKCFVTSPQERKPPYYAFMDVAWTEKGDSLVVAIMDSAKLIVDIEIHPGCDTPQIVRHLERVSKDWDCPIMAYDAQGRAAYLGQHVQGRGLRIRPMHTPNAEAKGKRCEFVAKLFEKGKIRIPHPDKYPHVSNRFQYACRRFRREMVEFVAEYKETSKGGYWLYGKRSGGNFTDDVADAVIGVIALSTQRGPVNTAASFDTYGV